MEKDFVDWYLKNYKKVLIVPALLIILTAIFLINFNAKNGDIIYKDVSLTGGTTYSVFHEDIDLEDLRTHLEEKYSDVIVRGISDIRSGEQSGFFVEVREEPEVIKADLEEYLGFEINSENSSVEFSGASLSEGFYKQLRLAIILAFVFMAIVVFVIFRTVIPSSAVILSALADIIMTIAVVDLMGMQLSTAGVIAFLMLIGYSVDTDILLTTRLLKERKGSVKDALKATFKTGITMTLTSIAAVTVALIMIFTLSDALRQIFTVLLVGLLFDIFNTWVMNAGILLWYVEKKEGKLE